MKRKPFMDKATAWAILATATATASALASLPAHASEEFSQLPSIPACADFAAFATQGKVDPKYISASSRGPLKPFMTDGIEIIKDGKPMYEWYDSINTKDTSHQLMSASKMLTATLLGRMIQEGYTYAGRKITLSTPLSTFFPWKARGRSEDQKARYEKITLENLIDMSSCFEWNEYYDEDISHSSFLPMLYLEGRQDMPDFALGAPMACEPGTSWNYSGGNANILMAVLEKVNAENSKRAASRFAVELLFEPLGLEHARVERDGSGHLVGSSYMYMSVRDMAKIGELYLQDGIWNGKRLLPEGWAKSAGELSPAVMSQATPLDLIKKEGAGSRRIFWVNQTIYRQDGEIAEASTGRKILYPQEMPEAPSDMYFAAGHQGQIIVVVPSHNLVIARTGHDKSYWDHVQPLVVKALSCLEPDYRPNPVADLTPPSAGEKHSFFEKVADAMTDTVPSLFKTLYYNQTTGIMAAMTAKELCSFLFVSGGDQIPGSDNRKIREYVSRSTLPKAVFELFRSGMTIRINHQEKSVTATIHGIGNGVDSIPEEGISFTGKLDADPTAGCRLQ